MVARVAFAGFVTTFAIAATSAPTPQPKDVVGSHIWTVQGVLVTKKPFPGGVTGLAEKVEVKRFNYANGKSDVFVTPKAVFRLYDDITQNRSYIPEIQCLGGKKVEGFENLTRTDCIFNMRASEGLITIHLVYADDGKNITNILQGPLSINGKHVAGPFKVEVEETAQVKR